MAVMPRKRHVSRNFKPVLEDSPNNVMPRKRHVSRNFKVFIMERGIVSHASQEACE